MKMKVYSEGGSFIGTLPKISFRRSPRINLKNDPEVVAFKRYYKEAMKNNLKGKDLVEYLFVSMFNDDDKSHLLDDNDINELVKKEKNRLHQRVKRYKRKLGFFHPNYFITFTYDDLLTDVDTFERQLRRALSNLSQRNEWRYIGVRENGAEGGRVHYHFLAYVPPGRMVGELFLDKQWSSKRRKYETFTNNTFFQERFGKCHFIKVSDRDYMTGNFANYLAKYMVKDDVRLIYSRHIPTEIECDINVDSDVCMTFFDFGHKFYLSLDLFFDNDELEDMGRSSWPSFECTSPRFDLSVTYQPRAR